MFLHVRKFIIITHYTSCEIYKEDFNPFCVFILTKIDNFFIISSLQKDRDPKLFIFIEDPDLWLIISDLEHCL